MAKNWVRSTDGSSGHYNRALAEDRLDMIEQTANEFGIALADDERFNDERHGMLDELTVQLYEVQVTTRPHGICEWLGAIIRRQS